jgi:hypothetical protein
VSRSTRLDELRLSLNYRHEKGYGEDEVDLRLVDISACWVPTIKIPNNKNDHHRQRQGLPLASIISNFTDFAAGENFSPSFLRLNPKGISV